MTREKETAEKIVERIIEALNTGNFEKTSFQVGMGRIVWNASRELGMTPEEFGEIVREKAEQRGVSQACVNRVLSIAGQMKEPAHGRRTKMIKDFSEAVSLAMKELKEEKGLVSGEDLLARVKEYTGLPEKKVLEKFSERGIKEEELRLMPARQSGMSKAERQKSRLDRMAQRLLERRKRRR